MKKSKFDPVVYAAMKREGFSNRLIAQYLGVDEASVRRGLAQADLTPRPQQFVITVTPA